MKYCILILSLCLVGCSAPTESRTNKKPHIVATTGMLYDAVINIGGDSITAEVLMGPGVDPHLYKATQGDLSKLNQAKIVVYNGILLEGKMSDILKKLGRSKITLAAAESIPDSLLIRHGDHEDAFDPHVWFDVSLWQLAVTAIGKSMINLDSANRTYYQSNLETYLSKLDSLDNYIKRSIQEIPEKQRILVTAHDAFGYFGQAYGVKVEAVQGLSTVSDFGLKDIADLIDLIIANDIRAIFVETSVSDRSINAIVTGCQKKGHEVVIGGNLYSDAMGELGTPEGTYPGMFTKNVQTIVEALK